MRVFHGFTIVILTGFVATSPATSKEDDEKVVITKDVYSQRFLKYKSDHDIISILVPLNSLNFVPSSDSEEIGMKKVFFFVEADFDDKKKMTYKGLYSFKDDKAKKLLENGQVAAAPYDDTERVYFGATDGLYEYKSETNEAVKYGAITDNIIGMAVTETGDIIYILTKDHELYKVTDSGNTKTKVEDVVNAQQIVLDYSKNLYFYTEDKETYVRTADGVKKVVGLPANPTEITLIKPPFYVIEDGVPAIVDNKAYLIYANGTSEKVLFEFTPKAKPTAFGMEAIIIQYYANDKKIYELDIATAGEILEEIKLKDYLHDKTNNIQAITRNLKRNRKA